MLGTGVPNWERIAVAFVRDHGLPTDLSTLDRLFNASLEEAWSAVYFLAAGPAFTRRSWELVARWSRAPDTWALADPLATLLVAGHLESVVIDEEVLREWARREEPFWFRRIALVTTTSPNGGLGGPTRRRLARLGRVPEIGRTPRPDLTFDLLESSLHDTRHFIRLGVGWALRPLAEIAPERVADFVRANRTHLTKAMLNKARLDEEGRRR